jgi:hypothetical protein
MKIKLTAIIGVTLILAVAVISCTSPEIPVPSPQPPSTQPPNLTPSQNNAASPSTVPTIAPAPTATSPQVSAITPKLTPTPAPSLTSISTPISTPTITPTSIPAQTPTLTPSPTPTPTNTNLGSIVGRTIISQGQLSTLYLFKGNNFWEKGAHAIDVTFTDAKGNYSFKNVEPGIYTIFGMTAYGDTPPRATGINPNWPHVEVYVTAGQTQTAASFSP